MSVKIEVVSKKKFTEEQGMKLVDDVEQVIVDFRREQNLLYVATAIWLASWSKLDEVRWLASVPKAEGS